TCSTGARLAEFTRRWLHIFAGAYESLRNGMDKRELQTAIKTLTDELTVFAGPLRTIAAGTLDPNRGDTGQAVRTIEFLLRDLTNISHTLKTGEYPDAETGQCYFTRPAKICCFRCLAQYIEIRYTSKQM
ncbi:MAG: hypothetical protein PHV59_05100, partial [Victivallales bacterium]|nr:hypothetical protein [Victivallales bacterium]